MTEQLSPLKQPAQLPAELRACTAFLLGRVGTAIKLTAIEEFERLGFNLYDYSVLAVLGEGVKETQAAIADALAIDRSQLVGVLDELERSGLIERRRDPIDRRRHTVRLTPAGKKRLVKMRTIVARIEDSFLAPLDDDARTALRDALLRVAANHDFRFDSTERHEESPECRGFPADAGEVSPRSTDRAREPG